MALSGSFYTNVEDHWRVYCSWTGSQSISGNYTDITLKVYWQSTDSYGTTYTNATKDGDSYVNGIHDSFTFSAKLNGHDSVLVHTQTERVNHNSDGTKQNVSLSATLGIELNLSGTFFGNVTTSDSVDLNTIPRASSLKDTSPGWTAGSNVTLSVNRASTSFTHMAYIDVKDSGGAYQNIKSLNFSTSASSSFSITENTQIFNLLNSRGSTDSRINLYTYNGSDQIGLKTYYGTISIPSISDVTSIDGLVGAQDGYSQYGYIDQTWNIDLVRYNSEFDHKVEIACGGFYKRWDGIQTDVNWVPTATEKNTLYAEMPNDNSKEGTITVNTYYHGEHVGGQTVSGIFFYVRNSDPIFIASQTYYKDVNASSIAITGNDQYIVQNVSELGAYLSSNATSKNYATMVKYIINCGGVEKTINQGTTSVNLGKINSGVDQILSIKAVDSRGNSTTVSLSVDMIPYKEPQLTSEAKRESDFETSTVVNGFGTYSELNIGGTNKNNISSLQFRYKPKDSGSYSSWANLTFSLSNGVFIGDGIAVNLNNTQAWTVDIKVVDILTTLIVSTIVDVGQPILFIDPVNRSIGFNDFPQDAGEFRINGRIVFGSTQWQDSSSQGEGQAGALALNNSDIVEINGLYFNDFADNDGEGLHFLKSGKTIGSIDNADYDVFRIADGQIILNGNNIMSIGNELENIGGLISIMTGVSSGTGLVIGGGGAMVIGSGESAQNYANETAIGSGDEQTRITSDNDIHMITGLQDGVAGSFDWIFTKYGELISPDVNGTAFDKYGNLVLKSGATSSAYWNIKNTDGTVMMGVPFFPSNTNGFSYGTNATTMKLLPYSNHGTLVFHYGGDTNSEFISASDTSNQPGAFYFCADGTIPTEGNNPYADATAHMYAGDYNTVSSRELKSNITKLDKDVLQGLRAANVYHYNYKANETWRGEPLPADKIPKQLGLMFDEAPEEIKSHGHESINLYSTIAYLWKGMQEVVAELDVEKENNSLLEARIEKLEALLLT